MMRASEPLLKIVLISIYALVIWKGVELSYFALIKERVDSVLLSSVSQPRTQSDVTINDLERILPNWHSVLGVRSDAVSASIAIKRLSHSATMLDLEPEAISILAVRPMSAQAWILLAGTRFLRGQPVEAAASALENGLMLAPNEDGLIAERLVYGLIIWEYLSPGAKERIAMDLAIAGQRHQAPELANVRTIIASKNPATRKDIRDRLERGADHKSLVDLLGL